MSFSIKHKRGIRNSLIALGVAGAMALAIQPSTALFTASGDTHGVVKTATLTVQVSPESLTFNNLAPGGNVDQNITVKNTGSVAATVHLKNNTQGGKLADGSALNPEPYNGGSGWQLLGFSVVGYGSATPVPSTAALNVDLGVLQPGQTKVYTMRASLSGDAGNDWQGAAVNIHPQITLTQVH